MGGVAGRDRSRARAADAASAGADVRLMVDDDGRGLSPSEREQVAKRGRGWTKPSRAPA